MSKIFDGLLSLALGWKKYLLYVAGAFAVLLAVWAHGYFTAKNGCKIAALKEKEKRTERAIKGAEKLTLDHGKQSSSDNSIDRENEERIYATPSDNRICLDQSHIKRLRELK